MQKRFFSMFERVVYSFFMLSGYQFWILKIMTKLIVPDHINDIIFLKISISNNNKRR